VEAEHYVQVRSVAGRSDGRPANAVLRPARSGSRHAATRGIFGGAMRGGVPSTARNICSPAALLKPLLVGPGASHDVSRADSGGGSGPYRTGVAGQIQD